MGIEIKILKTEDLSNRYTRNGFRKTKIKK